MLAQMLYGINASVGSQFGAEGWVVEEGGDGSVESLMVFGRDYQTTGFLWCRPANDGGYLRAGVGGRYDRAAA